MFDPSDPPDNFKEFSKQVRKSLEYAEIDSDDDYDSAIFYVSHNQDADIIYAFKIFEEHEQRIDPDQILYHLFPAMLKGEAAKFFALVLPAEKKSGEEVVMLLIGDINETHLFQAELDREYDNIELEPWERLDVMDFPELAVPYRRAIVYQG